MRGQEDEEEPSCGGSVADPADGGLTESLSVHVTRISIVSIS